MFRIELTGEREGMQATWLKWVRQKLGKKVKESTAQGVV